MNVLAPADLSARQASGPVEVFFDLTCPWCYVGSARIMRSVAAHAPSGEPGSGFPLLWRPFLLDQSIPALGVPRAAYFVRKFGSETRARRFYGILNDLALAEGLRFDFEAMKTIPSTLDAHRVLLWLRRFGTQDAVSTMVVRLMRAHFLDGLHIGDQLVLARLAVETGAASAAEIRSLLSGRDFQADVMQEHSDAQRRGVTGVPCVIANSMAISGLQDEKVIDAILRVASS